jgi:hypothetical protein
MRNNRKGSIVIHNDRYESILIIAHADGRTMIDEIGFVCREMKSIVTEVRCSGTQSYGSLSDKITLKSGNGDRIGPLGFYPLE